MKKLMILGASILQLPAILKAKEMGLQVIAVDMDKEAIGFKYADICLEISTLDINRVVEAAKKYEIDGVMTLASDMPMQTVAAINKELNLVGINEDTAIKATNKAEMRECLKENNIPIPEFYRVNNYESYIYSINKVKGKMIVKPADNSGSRGVFLIEDVSNKELIDYAFESSMKFSRSSEIIVEEFMEGPEVSVETLSVHGRVYIIAITDKLTTGAPRFVEMGHSQPSRLPDDIKSQIEAVAKDTVKSIGIINGPSHTEMIITSKGPKIVEIGARLGGDCITTHLVPLSTGIDMVKCCIEIAMGKVPDIKNRFNKGSSIRYFKSNTGKIHSTEGIDKVKKLPGVKEIFLTKSIGDIVGEVTSSVDRIGFIIAQAKDADTSIKFCEEAISLIKINLE